MGLDMSLERMPRFKDTTPKEVSGISGYFDWKLAKAKGSKYSDCTLKEWCGADEDKLSKEAIKFYEPFYTMKYWAWDTEQKYGHMMILEDVASWRKANAIHNWFVENVQEGVDDCGIYEVSKEQLENLLHICNLIKDKCRLVKGKIKNGERCENGRWTPIYEEGEYIENPAIAEEYLPTTDGFFFGGTEYDQWYMQDIEYTIEMLTKVLTETDFETHMIAYRSSW
jgi:hypothetical protein